MAENSIYAVIIVALLSSSCKTSKAYDHLKMVFQWPRSFCQINRCASSRRPLPLNFTIHGLWPDNYGQASLVNCKSSFVFTRFTDQAVLDRLDVSWPDLKQPRHLTEKHQKFWRDQWNKHGKCADSNFNKDSYFIKALDLKDQFHVLRILQSDGIKNGHQKVDHHKVNNSIATFTKHPPIIKCAKGFLTEIIICFNPKGDAFAKCQPPAFDPCGNTPVSFP